VQPDNPAQRIEQLDAMRQGVEYRFPVAIRNFVITLRPLSVAENVRVTSEVYAEVQSAPLEHRTSLMESTKIAQKTLVLASTTSPGEKDIHITDYILQRMTSDELQHLYMLWVDGCKKCSPAIEDITDADLMEMAALVKKNPEAQTQLSRSRLSALVRYLNDLSSPADK